MRKILIIEDDEDLREGLAFSLQMDGYEIRCAGTKRAAGLQFAGRQRI